MLGPVVIATFGAVSFGSLLAVSGVRPSQSFAEIIVFWGLIFVVALLSPGRAEAK